VGPLPRPVAARCAEFFGANGRCPRHIFTERLPGIVVPLARHTARLLQWLTHIVVALGGAAGIQLSRGHGMGISRRTLLRVLHRLPIPSFASPTVLGVDDFAMRTRQPYGPVLRDLERRQARGLAPGQRCSRQPLPSVAEPVCQPLTPRRATWLVLRQATKRTATETQQLTQLYHFHLELRHPRSGQPSVAARASGDHTGLPLRRGDPLRHHGHREAILYAQHAEVAEAIDLAQDLATLVRQRQPAQLESRLKRATTRTLEALQRFATGPRRSQGRVASSTARVRARERCPGEVTSHAAWGDGPYSAVRAKVVHVWEARV
jgi:hypothetical protein